MAFTADTGELDVHTHAIDSGKNELKCLWMMSARFKVEGQGAVGLEEGQKWCQRCGMKQGFAAGEANTVVDWRSIELLYGFENMGSRDGVGDGLKVAIATLLFNQGMGGNKPCMSTVTIGAA